MLSQLIVGGAGLAVGLGHAPAIGPIGLMLCPLTAAALIPLFADRPVGESPRAPAEPPQESTPAQQ